MNLHVEGCAYSDPSFMKDVTEAFLLPANCKRLNEIRPIKSAGWSLAHAYQVNSSLKFHFVCRL